MTREEAIRELYVLWDRHKHYEGKEAIRYFMDGNYTESLEIAIEALEQEPCDDCISRKAVLDAIDAHKYSDSFCEEHNIDWSINLGMVHILVNELPSVTPQQKIGRWISNAEDDLKISEYTCSNCKGLSDEDSDFCPKCGAKMVEPQNGGDADASSC